MAVKDWVVDYAYRAKAGLTFKRSVPKHYLGFTKENKIPVILLPGISLKWHFLKQLGNKISLVGHPVYVAKRLGRNLLSVDTSAELVHRLIVEQDLRNVIIVGHSKGGLIGKQLLAHYNKDGRIKSVIAIATPFSGTRLAGIVPHKAFKEMTSGSTSITNLHDQGHVNKHVYSIIPAYDNHIWHETGSYLKGAENIIIPVNGHHKIVFDKTVEKKVLEILSKLSKGRK
ncbi:MAG: hypothetical protein V4702_02290 [Patescibacteria group bacterium]